MEEANARNFSKPQVCTPVITEKESCKNSELHYFSKATNIGRVRVK